MKPKIETLGIAELSELYKGKELSPVEVVENQLRLIGETGDLNMFITVTGDLATAQARESERRYLDGEPLSPMDGIPYCAKDIFYTKGIPTTMGSEIFKDYYPEENATVIELLNGSGAVLLGKTNTHEFASGSTSDRSYFGPVKNPRNKQKVPGGSSGGSGAALAANICPAALGSDTTGSVRLPAAACGVVGMKATQGRVSKHNVYPLSDSLDHVGPMTRTVSDNALFLSVIAGYDPLDPWSLMLPSQDFGCEMGMTVKDMRIGVPYPLYRDVTQTAIGEAIDNVIRLLEQGGARIVELESPDPTGTFTEACRTMRICEAYALHRANLLENPGKIHPEIFEQMMLGEKFKAFEYIESRSMRREFQAHFKQYLRDVDLMITPTMPILPTDIGQREVEIDGVGQSVFSLYNSFTLIASFTGFPAMSMPCAVGPENLPVGLQLMSGAYNETKIYRAAYWLEKQLCALEGMQRISGSMSRGEPHE